MKTKEEELKHNQFVEMIKNDLYHIGFKEGKLSQREDDLEKELGFLIFLLNSNDKYRTGEIEKKIEEIKQSILNKLGLGEEKGK